jgi:Fe-S cluster biogenesis protein NfuA
MRSGRYFLGMGVLRRTATTDRQIEARISAILVEVQPLLRIEHCALQLVAFDAATGVLTISIDGNCPDCSVSSSIFATGIAARVKQRVAEVSEVRLAG